MPLPGAGSLMVTRLTLWLSVYEPMGFSLWLGTLPDLLNPRVPLPLH